MQIRPWQHLVCPLDGLPLVMTAAPWRCSRGHHFDVAREGYCNLLPAQHKASRDPGDSKDMVAARRRFLDAGHFAGIADRVAEVVIEMAAAKASDHFGVLDAGCGEGYYLERLSQIGAMKPGSGTLELVGIDVSKWAVRAAAKRPLPATFVVASNRQPPIAAGHADVILCLFGFPIWDGFKGIQSIGQTVLMVDPADDHLLELREMIYPTVTRAPAASIAGSAAAGYRLVREERVTYRTTLMSQAIIQDLLAMTPHGHRATSEGRTRLATIDQLPLTIDVALRLLVL